MFQLKNGRRHRDASPHVKHDTKDFVTNAEPPQHSLLLLTPPPHPPPPIPA